MGFEQAPITTAHQQGNSLAEQINQSLEAYLRSYVNFERDNWDEYLDLFEFCWNNLVHASTGMAPMLMLIKVISQTSSSNPKNPEIN